MSSILEYFPLDKARNSQKEVLTSIESAFKKGYKNVLLEAPVGSGKSAIAVTIARYLRDAHILTPRKALQDQYSSDFSKHGLALMKGRNAYPCTYPSYDDENYNKVYRTISQGIPYDFASGELTCSEGPCLRQKKIKDQCTEYDPVSKVESYPCPYHVAILKAQERQIVVHNLHSFIFQAYFSGRFDKRKVLIIDECHEIENVIRGFASKKITIPKFLSEENLKETENFKTLADWATWFSSFSNLFSQEKDKFGVSPQDVYKDMVYTLHTLSDIFGTNFVTDINKDPLLKKSIFEFIPEYVGNLANKYLFDFGDKRVLMSGTIYNKTMFCKTIGIKEDETCFIRIGSSFPKNNRPIYFKPEYRVDTSHKLWDENFAKLIKTLSNIFDIFNDVKGLVHTPSYSASNSIASALSKYSDRIVTHSKDNFQSILTDFYKSTDPKILLSPVCQQGVDFKEDRARFQVIIRVPYLNVSDAFVDTKVKNDFSWYNYQALILFGQQIGRINRSEKDFGATILIDDRFSSFLKRNSNILPKWVTEAIIYK
jgi:ATP-dependent DNA helicase DinG